MVRLLCTARLSRYTQWGSFLSSRNNSTTSVSSWLVPVPLAVRSSRTLPWWACLRVPSFFLSRMSRSSGPSLRHGYGSYWEEQSLSTVPFPYHGHRSEQVDDCCQGHPADEQGHEDYLLWDQSLYVIWSDDCDTCRCWDWKHLHTFILGLFGRCLQCTG